MIYTATITRLLPLILLVLKNHPFLEKRQPLSHDFSTDQGNTAARQRMDQAANDGQRIPSPRKKSRLLLRTPIVQRSIRIFDVDCNMLPNNAQFHIYPRVDIRICPRHQ